MINLILGNPGGGKSYEATAFHIIPAIKSGRKVITNLPVNLDYFEAVYPGSSDLIHVVYNIGVLRAFSTIDFYGDDWRHEDTGQGPLYVIDEAHFCLRRGSTRVDVEEWFSMHRHEGADVLLITQSYGKVDKNIIDMVQLVYRVKKKTAWGRDDQYLRKVVDGVRGETLNLETRDYDPAYFPFYKSHTNSNTSVSEAVAQDVVPFWRTKSMIAAFVFMAVGLPVSGYTMVQMISPDVDPVSENVTEGITQSSVSALDLNPVPPKVTLAPQNDLLPERSMPDQIVSSPSVSSLPVEVELPKLKLDHPYDKHRLHVQGYFHRPATGETKVMLVASQNSQPVFNLTDSDLIAAGYDVEFVTDCLVYISYDDYKEPLTCDLPSHSISSTRQILEREG